MQTTIKQKVFLAVMATVLGFILAINLATLMLLKDIGRREILVSLESGVSAYKRFESQRRELMLHQAHTLAATPFLKATLAIPDVDSDTVTYAVSQFDPPASVANIVVLNNNGKVLAAIGDQTSAIWQQAPLWDNYIANALIGEIVYDSIRLGEHFFQLAMVPSTSGEQVVGLLMITQPLDTVTSMQTLQDITGTSVALIFGENVIDAGGAEAEAFAAELVTSLETTLSSGAGDYSGPQVFDLSVADQDYFATRLQLGSAGDLVLYRSAELLPATVSQMRWITGVSSLLGVLLGLAFSGWIASRISKPIVAISQIAEDFGGGQIDARVTATSEDELGQLGLSFNRMADQIVSEQAQLLASKEAAEAANRAKSTFLATMSHEIRTPLNGVLGMTEVLSRNAQDPKQKHNLDIIRQSGTNLLAIINDILDFSKLEAEKLELDCHPIQLGEFMTNLCNSHLSVCQNKGVAFEHSIIPEQELWIEADSTRLCRILNNLIGNAIKFTQSGIVIVTAEVLSSDNHNARIRFSVNDTGIGISAADLSDLFEPFTQVDDSHSRQFGGTGLGLAISKQLVELMDGEITATSEFGKGSNFSFELQFKVNGASTRKNTPKMVPAPPMLPDIPPNSATGTRGSVLIVEDCPINQEVAILMLEAQGCEVSIAENGRTALEITETQVFDLIFMDCHMPVMDGYDSAKAIRQREKSQAGAQVPIIALTANAIHGDRDFCLAAGMDDYVSKPYTVEDLASMLDRWLPQPKL